MWSTGEGNGKPLQYSCLGKPMNSIKRQKDRTLKDELSSTGDPWRNNSRKNEETEPKQKQHPVVDVTGDRSKIRCCKEQYYRGTWNVRSVNESKLEVVKQEMARVSIDVLGNTELKWRGFPSGSDGKASVCNAGDPGLIPGLEAPLEKEMAACSSTLAWKSPWIEEPGRLQSMGLQRVGHN